ncbi:MAG: protein translocase subunit SecF [Candidatus Obscuribacterales bacterium]|nr:protein translocase subunit SecF [Candidatus Obscuribacterales bacterium]
MNLPKVDIVKYRNWWFGISLFLTIPGIIGIIMCLVEFHAPLKPGIDFTGGSIMQYEFEKPVDLQEVRDILEKGGLTGSQVQQAQIGGQEVIVMRTKALSDEKQDEQLKRKLNESLGEKLGPFKVLSVDKVSGIVGPELLQNGLLALFLTFAAMVIYIRFRFMIDYAMCAIAALVHDVLVLCGFFALMGVLFGTEVDSLFISAVLTVIGFSVHDTIVVFDRVRENTKYIGSKYTDQVTGQEHKKTFGDVANDSVNQTLARSIYTSLTVVITLLALYFLGGVTTREFVLAMLIGIASGTYSSIFNASCLLVWWREFKSKQKNFKPATA